MDWEKLWAAMPGEVACASLEPLPATLPLGREEIERLGARGLQFGSLQRLAPGCLNTDLCGLFDLTGKSTDPGRLYRVDGRSLFLQHDATAGLPFADASFAWAYAEHFIEHVSLSQALGWLREVRRVLRPGGLLRLTTPDLRRYVLGYLDPADGFFAAHRERLRSVGFPPMAPRKAWMVNQIFQFWGHRWIYDLDELRWAVTEAGFDPGAFTERAYREGRDPRVSALDYEYRNDETIYVEVTA